MIKKTIDTVLNVRPIFVGIQHLYFYEGPCRFGEGDEPVSYTHLINAPRECAVILRRTCQLSLTRITPKSHVRST